MKTEYIYGIVLVAIVGFYLYTKNKTQTAIVPNNSILSNLLRQNGGSILATGTAAANGIVASAGTALSNAIGNLGSSSSGIWNPTETTNGTGSSSS